VEVKGGGGTCHSVLPESVDTTKNASTMRKEMMRREGKGKEREGERGGEGREEKEEEVEVEEEAVEVV